MTASVDPKPFKRSVLATVIALSFTTQVFALEQLTDETLGDTTGEGIAFVPEDFAFLFRGENATGALTDRTKDTGYINLIPVGPLSVTATDTNKSGALDANDLAVGKADLFLYGLALTKADNNSLTSRVATNGSNLNGISSWGDANNPWIIRVDTAANIPNFNKNNTEGNNVSFLSLEAPLYENSAANRNNDAHQLKLGLWADLFVRNPNVAVDPSNLADPAQFHYGTSTGVRGNGTSNQATDRANRLRLQGIWNNFSVNGTQLQLFQTLDGASGDATLSPFYDNTLGMAGMLRLNSGDTSNLRASFSTTGALTTSYGSWNTSLNGTSYDDGKFGCGSANINAQRCQYQFRYRTVTETVDKSKVTWAVSEADRSKYLRFSTKETTNTELLKTSALNGTPAPTFDDTEGLHLYHVNINLPLGSLYQPLVIGSDGKNFNIEIARLPNKASVYNQIYTAYRDAFATEAAYNAAKNTYKGSTCNVHQCGSTLTAGNGVVYQDSRSANYGTRPADAQNATHASITIGSTEYNPTYNQLYAHKGVGSFGVSFGALKNHNPANTTAATQTYTDLQYQQRRAREVTYTWTDKYNHTGSDPYGGSTCYVPIIGCNKTKNNIPGSHNYWEYLTAMGTWDNTGAQCVVGGSTTACQTGDNNGDRNVGQTGRWSNTAWGTNRAWIDATSVERNIAFKNNPSLQVTPSPLLNKYQYSENNLGSAVIDGLLIQHMKLTTTGL